MRLDFSLLWIDDQTKWIDAQSVGLSTKMREHGFVLNVKSADSVAAARVHLGDSVFRDHVDLVLVDYDLGAGPKGSEAFKEIRGHLSYRDIVFYSAKPTAELRKIAYESEVEGVYCSSREDLVETTLGVFEAQVKKVLDIDHTRGIVMGATSDIDHVVYQLLVLLHGALNAPAQKALLDEIHKFIDEKLDALKVQAEEARNSGKLETALEAYDLLTAYDRLRLVTRQLKGKKEHEGTRKRITDYMDKVIPKRNKLGHVTVVIENGLRVLKGRGGQELKEEDLRQLRRDLLDHRVNFDELLKLLQNPPGT